MSGVAHRRPLFFLSLAALLSCGCAPPASPTQPNDDPVEESQQVTRPAITISKETTYLLAPRAANGYIDYVAAINELAREGVTVENNAVVELAEAFGDQLTPGGTAEAFFQMLGIPIPKPAVPFVTLPAHLLRHHQKDPNKAGGTFEAFETLGTQFVHAETQPWSEQEFPLVADWLQVNRVPLECIKRASRRTRFFAPMVTGATSLLEFDCPGMTEVRDAARALRTRAMLRVRLGESDAAWSDLIAAHRVCKIAAQGPMLVNLFGVTLGMSDSFTADAAMATHARLPAKRLRQMQEELSQFSGPLLTERHVQSNRLVFLSKAVELALNGPGAYAANANGETLGPDDWKAISAGIDWDSIMREGNQWFDRAADITRHTDPALQQAELDQWRNETDELHQDWDLQQFRRNGRTRVLDATPAARNRMFGSLLRQTNSLMWVSQSKSAKRLKMRWPLTEAAFALAAYRADHGHYPDRLAELVPDYLASLPRDVYSDGELNYQSTPSGFLLYSVGENGSDDGGQTYGSGNGSDDLVVSAP